uniref:Uncharacterized protein n=1 Tax=Pithovirus LCPAC304 TaxID=2506594 RepID=A0A481Z7P9_9VIRU|nr:MAG: hypothetical protein LCPAC304_02640 [Pithovirus LCPAC304]
MSGPSYEDLIDVERVSMINRRSRNSEWEDYDDLRNFADMKNGTSEKRPTTTGKTAHIDQTTRDASTKNIKG